MEQCTLTECATCGLTQYHAFECPNSCKCKCHPENKWDQEVLDEATHAFWDVIQEHVQLPSGDTSPEQEFVWDSFVSNAVQEHVQNNSPWLEGCSPFDLADHTPTPWHYEEDPSGGLFITNEDRQHVARLI